MLTPGTCRSSYSLNAQLMMETDNIGHLVNPVKKAHLSTAAFVCLFTGIGTIIMGKLQNRHSSVPCRDCTEPVYFQQPLFQTLLMFTAESLCMIPHLFDVCYRRRRAKPRGTGKLEFAHPPEQALEYPMTPWYMFAIPSLTDLLGTGLINFAFTITYASTVQLLRNFVILVTACTTMLIMKRALVVHEWIGIVVMTLGMVIAGADSLTHPEPMTNSTRPTLGIILTLVGTIGNALTLTAEEHLLKRYYCAPMRAVAWSGITGLMWSSLAIPIAQKWGIVDMKAGWYQLRHSSSLILSSFGFVGCSFLFNASGMIVTQLGSGLLKSLIYSCRGPLMWIFEICKGWQSFTYFGLLGLIGTYLGFLIYTDLVLPGRMISPASWWRKPLGCGPCKPHTV